MRSISLCINCLETNAQPRPIGPDQGPQMDSYRHTIDMCIECWDALLEGKMRLFHFRYRDSREFVRYENE